MKIYVTTEDIHPNFIYFCFILSQTLTDITFCHPQCGMRNEMKT